MKIDLTHKLDGNNPVLKKIKDSDKNYLNLGHIGTHLDSHLKTEIPLDYIVNRGVLIDISNLSSQEIMLNGVDISNIKKDDFVIFKTDEIKKYGYGTKEYFGDGVQLSHELIDFLINTNIRFIGIDALGIRNGKEHTPIDKKCELNGIYVIENLDNLTALQNQTNLKNIKEFKIHIMWMNYEGTGLPCRVIAELI
jgi:kynurenine formamidase